MMEELVPRDGTDYGERETPLAEKMVQVRTHLQSGQTGIVFLPAAGELPESPQGAVSRMDHPSVTSVGFG